MVGLFAAARSKVLQAGGKSPYISVFEARMLAAEHNIELRF